MNSVIRVHVHDNEHFFRCSFRFAWTFMSMTMNTFFGDRFGLPGVFVPSQIL